MPGKAAKVVITERQQDVLLAVNRSVSISFQLQQRTWIILLFADINPEPAGLPLKN